MLRACCNTQADLYREAFIYSLRLPVKCADCHSSKRLRGVAIAANKYVPVRNGRG